MQTVAELFGVALRRVRYERGLSQEALAEATGLSANFVGEMERGLNAPGLGVIVRLARALDVGVHDLLADFTEATIRRVCVRPTAHKLSCAARAHVPKSSGATAANVRAAGRGARVMSAGMPPATL